MNSMSKAKFTEDRNPSWSYQGSYSMRGKPKNLVKVESFKKNLEKEGKKTRIAARIPAEAKNTKLKRTEF